MTKVWCFLQNCFNSGSYIPIVPKEWDAELVGEETRALAENLRNIGLSVHVDKRDIRPGEKFYEWEKKGVPVRIEIGPKDIAANTVVVARRDTSEKKVFPLTNIAEEISVLLIPFKLIC